MNEDTNSPVQENNGTDNPNEEETGARGAQVFDISSDDIKPIKEDVGPGAPPLPKKLISTITPLPSYKKAPLPEMPKDFPETPHLVNLIDKNHPDLPPATPNPVPPPRPVSSQPPLNPQVTHASVDAQPTLPRSPAAQPFITRVEPQNKPSASVSPKPPVSPVAAPQTIPQNSASIMEPKPIVLDNRVHPEIPLDPNIKPLRTYEDDVAEALAHQRASAASIALAESRKREGSETIGNSGQQKIAPVTHGFRNTFIVLLCLIMIGAGSFAAYYFYLRSPLAPTPIAPNLPSAPSLIRVDSRASIIVDGLNSNQILSRISEEIGRAQPDGTIREIILSTAKNNVILRVPAAEMIRTLAIEPPDVLLRSLTPDWMLGSYVLADGSKSAFVIITTNFFQNTFAGMLQWERVMADDLKKYLYPVAPIGVANIPENSVPAQNVSSASSTATSTQIVPIQTRVPIVAHGAVSGRFEDKLIRNKDVRVFRTDNGRILFLYSFLDNKKLIITNSEATLSEILLRLEKGAFVR